MNTFGDRLRDARKKSKLTQKEVAKRVGMSQPLLSELENNEYPTSGFTAQLAHLYKVSARWLAEGKGPRDIPSSELVDDPKVAEVWNAYSQLDDATKSMVDLLLNMDGLNHPNWLSPGVVSSLKSIQDIVLEQYKQQVSKQKE